MIRAYLSGPITKGNRSWNFYQAAEFQRRLMLAGLAVWNPMLSMLHPDGWSIPHHTWLESDLAWVAVANVVLRLPGESVGADAECAFARDHGIPVLLVDVEDDARKTVRSVREALGTVSVFDVNRRGI